MHSLASPAAAATTMHQPQWRMNNTRSAAHSHEFDRVGMRGETPAYAAGGGWGRGEGVPARGCRTHSVSPRVARLVNPGARPVTIPASSPVA